MLVHRTYTSPQITHIFDTFETNFSPFSSLSTAIKGDSWGFLGYHSPSALSLFPPRSYSKGILSMCLCIYLTRKKQAAETECVVAPVSYGN